MTCRIPLGGLFYHLYFCAVWLFLFNASLRLMYKIWFYLKINFVHTSYYHTNVVPNNVIGCAPNGLSRLIIC